MLPSSLAVAPAPKGVPLADTTPALIRVDKRFEMSAGGGAEGPGIDADVEGKLVDTFSILTLLKASE